MLFLDVLYIVCCDFYRNREKDTFKQSGIILLSAAFTMNLLFLFFVFKENYSINAEDAGLYIVGIYLFILLPTLAIRYYKFTNYDKIMSRIYKLSNERKMLYFIPAIIYILCSFILTISFAIYLGGKVKSWW